MNKQKLKELVGSPPPDTTDYFVSTLLTPDGNMIDGRPAIGMTLTWFVQRHGLWETKEGVVRSIILANDGEVYNGLISEGVKPGYIKFKRTSRRDRVLMLVRRHRSDSGAKLPSYWYAPLLSNNFYYKPE